MKKWVNMICTALIIAISYYNLVHASHFPVDSQKKISEKYAGWNGVLQICVRESADKAFLKALREESESFEKRHSGVYVEIFTDGDEELTDVLILHDAAVVSTGERGAMAEKWVEEVYQKCLTTER